VNCSVLQHTLLSHSYNTIGTDNNQSEYSLHNKLWTDSIMANGKQAGMRSASTTQVINKIIIYNILNVHIYLNIIIII